MELLLGLAIIALFFGAFIAVILGIGLFPEYVIALGIVGGLIYLAVDLAA